MRGHFRDQGGLFSYISPETRVPALHPLREIRELVRAVLKDLGPSFGKLYASEGRPSIPPEQLLSALLLQVFYGIRSERPGRPRLGRDDLHQEPGAFAARRRVSEVHDEASEPSAGEAALVRRAFFGGWDLDRGLGVAEELQAERRPRRWRRHELAQTEARERNACEHDGSREPPLPQGGRREAKLCYLGHVAMENRHGLAVAGMVTTADGRAERSAAQAMLKAKRRAIGHRITAGADKAYDTSDHVETLRAIDVTPHVAQNQSQTKTGKLRRSAIDGRTTCHAGYGLSQKRRKMIECIFGWGKQHGTMRKTKHRSAARVGAGFLLNLIAYNLIRIPKLITA